MVELRNRHTEGGYVFIDILIALIITGIAFAVLFGAVSLSTRNTARIRERVNEDIRKKNEFVETRSLQFLKK